MANLSQILKNSFNAVGVYLGLLESRLSDVELRTRTLGAHRTTIVKDNRGAISSITYYREDGSTIAVSALWTNGSPEYDGSFKKLRTVTHFNKSNAIILVETYEITESVDGTIDEQRIINPS